jgi:hypothetical protein
MVVVGDSTANETPMTAQEGHFRAPPRHEYE